MDAAHRALTDTNNRVSHALSTAPDILPYQDRIARLREQLDTVNEQLTQVINASENQLLAEIVRELNTQQRRLTVYLSQARLSIARIYDAESQGERP